MYGVHHSYRVDPNDVDGFLTWQNEQWQRVRTSEGFDNGSLTRGIVEQDRFYAIALWDTEDAFRLIEGERWLAPGPLAGILEHEADEAISCFDDIVTESIEGMIGTHVIYTTVDGGADTFQVWKIHEGDAQRAAPGFIKRSMSRSATNPNVFYYYTYWKDVPSIDAFVNSAAFKKTNQQSNIQAVMERPNPVRVHEIMEFRR
jgi:heme-degrading monooxygenase HmoA